MPNSGRSRLKVAVVVVVYKNEYFVFFSDISKRLEEQSKIVEELEKDKEKLSQKIYKLEKQLLSQNQHSADQDLGCSVDTVRIEIKHKVI